MGIIMSLFYMVKGFFIIKKISPKKFSYGKIDYRSASVETLEKKLIEGMNVKEKNKDGMTALMFAALESSDVDVLKFLISNGSDPIERDLSGGYPFMYACINKNIKVLEYLFQYVKNVDNIDNSGWTPLIQASHVGNLNAIEFLISHGANVNHKDKFGMTALMRVCNEIPGMLEDLSNYNDPKVARLLISNGADITVEDDMGLTAYDYAKETKKIMNSEVFKYLQIPKSNEK
jgi:ankyrin repeat protein